MAARTGRCCSAGTTCDYYNHAYAMNQYLASRGYVVLAVNYRSGIGYGLNFREAPTPGSGAGRANSTTCWGRGSICAAGRTSIRTRIGLWGGSYGGYLTALGLARASNLFAAGVDLHGVHDWNEGIRNFIPDYHPTPERGAAGLRVVAGRLARRLALAGAADPGGRRPQRLVQPDGEAGRGVARTERPRGAARAAGRDPRLPAHRELAGGVSCGGGLLRPRAEGAA